MDINQVLFIRILTGDMDLELPIATYCNIPSVSSMLLISEVEMDVSRTDVTGIKQIEFNTIIDGEERNSKNSLFAKWISFL